MKNVNNVLNIKHFDRKINRFPVKLKCVSLSKRCHFLDINDVRLRKQVQ